jgi:imidazole glycerol-phosphate synthase subunit HisF
MIRPRIIPALLIKDEGLVKTRKFQKPRYIGEPINAVKIFNGKEVDELVILDISAGITSKGPNFKLIKNIAAESFMPFGYGGGISNISEIEQLFSLGVEKVILNSAAYFNSDLISEASEIYGNQSIVVSVDFKKRYLRGYGVYVNGGRRNVSNNLVEYVQLMEHYGAGEILLTSIDNDGMMAGYDIEVIRKVSEAVKIPVVACGGAGNIEHLHNVINNGKSSAAAAGSMFIYNGVHRAVLINYPEYKKLLEIIRD